MRLQRVSLVVSVILMACAQTISLRAQGTPTTADLGVTYSASRALRTTTGRAFWMQGGSAELGVALYRGLGVAANVTGSHTGSTGPGGVPLSLVTATVGPRYRFLRDRRLSAYGEALFGLAHGFDGTFPSVAGPTLRANSLAIQVGGGIDYRFRRSASLRILDVGLHHSSLPNGADNVQNSLRIGAGFVLHFH